MLSGAVEQYVCRFEESLAEADPSGGHVEQIDRRQLGVWRPHLDGKSEVVRRAHEEERRESVQEVAEPGKRDLDALLRPTGGRTFRQREPERGRLELPMFSCVYIVSFL